MPRVMWQCKCGKFNRTSVDFDPVELDDDPDSGVFREAKCSGCGGKHWLLVVFRVEADVQQVKTDEEYQTMLAEEEKEVEEARRKGYTKPFRISRDNGETWENMDICLLDTDPAKSPLKEGDLVQRRDLPADDPYGQVRRIVLRGGYLTAEPVTEVANAKPEVPSGPEEVKARFRGLAKLAHPDAGGKQEDFEALNRAAEQALKWFETTRQG